MFYNVLADLTETGFVGGCVRSWGCTLESKKEPGLFSEITVSTRYTSINLDFLLTFYIICRVKENKKDFCLHASMSRILHIREPHVTRGQGFGYPGKSKRNVHEICLYRHCFTVISNRTLDIFT